MQNHLNLDWKIRLLDRILSLSKPIHEMSLDELHQDQTSEAPIPAITQRVLAGKRIEIPNIVQQSVEGRHGEIPIQVYRPFNAATLPLILFFHGGGWIYGNLQTHDRICRRIAYDTGAIVLAVRYHLAPFFKYPIALEDCYDVLTWAVENAENLGVDRENIMVMGDSAGGNLAATLCLMLRDQTESIIAQQILLYPVTSGILNQDSIERNAHAPVLTKESMQYYINCYAQSDSDILKPYFSPLLAEDLSHLPPALIVTAEFDPLRDQGQQYAQRLEDAGNSVQLIDYLGMVHGFMSFSTFCREALPAFQKVADYIKKALGLKTV